ncbi:MAG: methyltransferase domain-containing protein [Spirochaeta sp.]|jgi:ubiquinone/menaquinone biosynthesis C-methylase UbiE|nr:methyltransferase domain-containing protein [Spirochaeta sp.]
METQELKGPIHRLGHWIVDRFVNLPRWVRLPLWRYWHAKMINWDTEYDGVRFMNYGYAPIDAPDLVLEPEDRTEPYGAHLYHVAVSHVPVADKEILEVSSGRGGGASYIARYLQPRRYVGLDISDKNVEACERIYGELTNVEFVQGEAERLPFPEDAFDHVVSVEASRAYGDVMQFFAEVRRVLRPEGTFLLTDMRWYPDMEALKAQIREAGFAIESEVDIAPNVVRALERDNERKVELIQRRVPKMFLSAFSEFAGTIGSDRYRAFADGRMNYFSWNLRPA